MFVVSRGQSQALKVSREGWSELGLIFSNSSVVPKVPLESVEVQSGQFITKYK